MINQGNLAGSSICFSVVVSLHRAVCMSASEYTFKYLYMYIICINYFVNNYNTQLCP